MYTSLVHRAMPHTTLSDIGIEYWAMDIDGENDATASSASAAATDNDVTHKSEGSRQTTFVVTFRLNKKRYKIVLSYAYVANAKVWFQNGKLILDSM